MTEKFENKNMVHVDDYTRANGTHVDDYWRRKSISGIPEPDMGYYKTDPFNRNVGDIFQEDLYLGLGSFVISNGKTANAFLKNAANNFEDAKKDPNATIYESGNSIPNANLRKFITEDKNITNFGKIDVKNMRGAYYNSKSNVSIAIANDPAIQRLIKENYSQYVENGKKIEENNKKIPKGGEKYFENQFVDKANPKLEAVVNIGDIGNCTLYNPHIDKNGHFKAQMIDIVDYESKAEPMPNNSTSSNYLKSLGLNMANQWGYKMQQNGRIENVFHIVDIDIPVTN